MFFYHYQFYSVYPKVAFNLFSHNLASNKILLHSYSKDLYKLTCPEVSHTFEPSLCTLQLNRTERNLTIELQFGDGTNKTVYVSSNAISKYIGYLNNSVDRTKTYRPPAMSMYPDQLTSLMLDKAYYIKGFEFYSNNNGTTNITKKENR